MAGSKKSRARRQPEVRTATRVWALAGLVLIWLGSAALGFLVTFFVLRAEPTVEKGTLVSVRECPAPSPPDSAPHCEGIVRFRGYRGELRQIQGEPQDMTVGSTVYATSDRTYTSRGAVDNADLQEKTVLGIFAFLPLAFLVGYEVRKACRRSGRGADG